MAGCDTGGKLFRRVQEKAPLFRSGLKKGSPRGFPTRVGCGESAYLLVDGLSFETTSLQQSREVD